MNSKLEKIPELNYQIGELTDEKGIPLNPQERGNCRILTLEKRTLLRIYRKTFYN